MYDYDTNADAYRRWSVTDNDYWLVEQTRYFQVLGCIRNLNVLELACGDGRISRLLMERGARLVFGTDISEEMIKKADEQNKTDDGSVIYPTLSFAVVDACDETFTLDCPADLVTAMYLFHYAPTERALVSMCSLIGRNLRPGGRFVAYTVNPDFHFESQDPRLEKYFGFYYRPIHPPHYHLVFPRLTVNMWHWSKEMHEDALKRAGLTNIEWHPLCLPDDRKDLAPVLQWYLDNPSCIVVSAQKPSGN